MLMANNNQIALEQSKKTQSFISAHGRNTLLQGIVLTSFLGISSGCELDSDERVSTAYIATESAEETESDDVVFGDTDSLLDTDTGSSSDECPDDPLKTEPGICGCGSSDIDSDGDGVVNCLDVCPADPKKQDVGSCGCGVVDVDSDSDGLADCKDECPFDEKKTEPGLCGCGGPLAPMNWYPDCDGDGLYGTNFVSACSQADANRDFDCRDGCDPDGGWSSAAGEDCNDENFLNNNGNCGSFRSCLEILKEDQHASDGSYEITPNGVGGNDPIRVFCDMSGGGWTVVYSEDFTSGDSSGWTRGLGGPAIEVDSSSDCAEAYSNILGGPGRLGKDKNATQSFPLLGIPHTEATVELDYIFIDSWDGENGSVWVDGEEQWSFSFNYRSEDENRCGGPWSDPAPQPVRVRLSHAKNSILVEAKSTLDQDSSDESFALDNILIRIR